MKKEKTERVEVLKEASKNKGNIGIIIVLIIIILGFFAYICYDKGVFDGLLGNKTTTPEPKQEVKLSDEEVMKLYDSLIVEGRGASLYFNEATTIDDVAAEYFLPFALLNYEKDKNMNNLPSDSDDADAVSKSLVDEYIKEKFNTNREFTMPAVKDDMWDGIYIYWPGKSTVCFYDANSYYFTNVGHGAGTEQHYSKFIKSEQDNDNVYVYAKSFLFWSMAGETPHEIWSGKNKVLSYSVTKQNSDTKWISNPGSFNASIDSDYIFNNYSDKLATFKVTFKKASDGKYYWYSSEIVNE